MSKTHYLKIQPEYREAIEQGLKLFELRFNDRNFQVGDKLVLQEYDTTTRSYTDKKSIEVIVTYLFMDDRFIQPGYVCMGIRIKEGK